MATPTLQIPVEVVRGHDGKVPTIMARLRLPSGNVAERFAYGDSPKSAKKVRGELVAFLLEAAGRDLAREAFRARLFACADGTILITEPGGYRITRQGQQGASAVWMGGDQDANKFAREHAASFGGIAWESAL